MSADQPLWSLDLPRTTYRALLHHLQWRLELAPEVKPTIGHLMQFLDMEKLDGVPATAALLHIPTIGRRRLAQIQSALAKFVSDHEAGL